MGELYPTAVATRQHTQLVNAKPTNHGRRSACGKSGQRRMLAAQPVIASR